MKSVILSLCLLLTGCVAHPRQSNTPVPKPVIDEAVNDTMALVNVMGDVYCAGVILQGLLVTAEHCVDGEQPIWAGYRGPDNKAVGSAPFDILYVDDAQDLAILRPQTYSLRNGRLLAPESPVDGDRVVAVGHPIGLTWTITEGIVSRSSRVGGVHKDQHWMQVSAPIYFGNSGGPIYNVYGEVVGIASFIASQPHLAGVVHWDEIKAGLDRVTRD